MVKLTKKSNMRHKKPNRSRVGDFLVGLLLFLVACAMAFPLVFAISSSLKPLDELLKAFVAQHRMKLPGGAAYVPCYRVVQ